jgi:hypothetical protein
LLNVVASEGADLGVVASGVPPWVAALAVVASGVPPWVAASEVLLSGVVSAVLLSALASAPPRLDHAFAPLRSHQAFGAEALALG